MSHFWVFGYGSLMWNPGFEYDNAVPARMVGVHRSPCIYSWVHRGTRQRPGIVLGLARGGSCRGVGFKVREANREHVIGYLRDRELVTNVYVETNRSMVLEDGQHVTAVTYVADPMHDQYAGRLGHAELVRQIKGAVGKSGDNESYFVDTAKRLRELGIKDGLIETIVDELRRNEV